MIDHTEAQELHELIGAAIEASGTNGLDRAREIAATLVADTIPEEAVPEETEYNAEAFLTIRAGSRQQAIAFMRQADERIATTLRALPAVTFSTESTAPDYGIEEA